MKKKTKKVKISKWEERYRRGLRETGWGEEAIERQIRIVKAVGGLK